MLLRLVNGVKKMPHKLLGFKGKFALFLLVQLHSCMSVVAAIVTWGESCNCVKEENKLKIFLFTATVTAHQLHQLLTAVVVLFFFFFRSLSSEAHLGFPPSLFFCPSTCENKLHHAA